MASGIGVRIVKVGHGDNAPMEIALTALASCLIGTLVYYGALMGIELDEVSAQLEGDLDMRGLFGIEETTRKGLQHVRVDYRIKSPEPRERIVELLGLAQKFSPLNDIFTNQVPVSMRLVD
jgi:putative redox protein